MRKKIISLDFLRNVHEKIKSVLNVPCHILRENRHQRILESGGEESTKRPFPLPVESDFQFQTAARVPELLFLQHE